VAVAAVLLAESAMELAERVAAEAVVKVEVVARAEAEEMAAGEEGAVAGKAAEVAAAVRVDMLAVAGAEAVAIPTEARVPRVLAVAGEVANKHSVFVCMNLIIVTYEGC